MASRTMREGRLNPCIGLAKFGDSDWAWLTNQGISSNGIKLIHFLYQELQFLLRFLQFFVSYRAFLIFLHAFLVLLPNALFRLGITRYIYPGIFVSDPFEDR